MAKIIKTLKSNSLTRERGQDIVLGRKIPESREKDFVRSVISWLITLYLTHNSAFCRKLKYCWTGVWTQFAFRALPDSNVVLLKILCLTSIWQRRRILITKECISFAFVHKDEEIDRIPFVGVDFVKAHVEAVTSDHTHDQTHGFDGQSQDFLCFQVGTNPEGYNSGRTYTLRTHSKKLYDETLPLLIKFAKKARKRAQARSLFQKCQLVVRRIYSHHICQSSLALIIMGVSNSSVPHLYRFV